MIQAQSLPPNKTIYDYPVVLPGEEPTEAQQAQMTIAQIAGIVMAVSAGKSALEAATTNQLVEALRTTNLLVDASVDTFIAFVKFLLPEAQKKARELTWTGVALRAELVGVDFPDEMPEDEDIPRELFYPRSSSLDTAYRRIAEEYKENLQRTKDDPVIKELVTQMEHQGMTPLPRPDNISSDAVERVADSDESWAEAFRKAEEEASETTRRALAENALNEEVRKNLESEALAREWQEVDIREFSGDDTAEAEASLERREEELRPEPGLEADGADRPEEDAEDEDPRLVQLTDAEIQDIIERYAEHKAEERVERMVSQDIQGASRNMHQVAMRNTDPKQVTGFRRVVHPELSESGRSCGLCIVASTMRYTRGDLLPIHSGCNCETVEIYKVDGVEYDPGEQINMQDLGIFYEEAGGTTRGWDLKRQRYQVFNHPEYGPTLINVTSKKANENATEVGFNQRRA